MHAWSKAFQFSVIHVFTYLPLFRKSSGKKLHWTSNSTVDVLRRLFHITPGVGLGGLFHGISSARLWDWKWKTSQGLSYYQKSRGILLRLQSCVAVLVWVCVCVCVCMCALGVVLLNVANSDAHADGSTEMVSVSKVPLAVCERKDVSAANAFEHSRFQINFPCCLLGRRRWGLGQAHSCSKIQPQLGNFLHTLLCHSGWKNYFSPRLLMYKIFSMQFSIHLVWTCRFTPCKRNSSLNVKGLFQSQLP